MNTLLVNAMAGLEPAASLSDTIYSDQTVDMQGRSIQLSYIAHVL